MANGTSSTNKFPAPYVNSVNENDSYVIRVNQDMSEIGARKSAMPSDVASSGMAIQHVGGKV